MKKRLISTILILGLLFTMSMGLAGCGEKSNQGESKASKEKITIKLGHQYDESQPLHQGCVKFAEMVKEGTDGNVEVKIFPNGTLGSARDLVEGCKMDTIDMALIPTNNVAALYAPIDAFYLPFIFRDKEHAYKVADGPVGQELYDGLLKKEGIRTLAMFESGFRTITNSKRPIHSPEDFAGIKMRAGNTPILVSTFKALNCNVTPMALTELFTALQQGTVDGQDNPIGNVYSYKFYEVQKYMTRTGHQWAGLQLLINEKTWKEIPAEYQEVMKDAAKKAETWEREEINANEAKYLDVMKKAGMQVIDPTPEERAVFQEKMKPVWTEFEGVIGKDIIDAVINTK